MCSSDLMIARPMSLKDMLDWLVKTGEHGVKVMALLDKANTSTFGNPEISKVNIGVVRIREFLSADTI